MSNVIPFTYQDQPVRVVEIDGEPWFVLADLCKVLDLAKPSRVAMRIADDMKGAHQVSTPGGTQQMTIVSEAGVYEVVIRSDKPEAAAFRRWITTEVLPSIRRTGQYGAVAELSRRDLAHMIIDAEDAREAAEMRAKELEPAAKAWTAMAACHGDMSVDHAAKVLSRDKSISTGRNRLFTVMADAGWIYRGGERNQWHAYQPQIENGRLTHKLSGPFLNHRTGELEIPAPTIRITAKGLSVLHRILGGTDDLDYLLSSDEEAAA